MKLITTIILVSFFMLFAQAQNSSVKKGNKKFEDLAYIDAIDIYKSVVKKDKVDIEVYRKLADSYYFIAKYSEAAKWYKKYFAMSNAQLPEYVFRYGQSLKSIGAYEAADEYLTRFYHSEGFDYVDSQSFLNSIEKKSNRFEIKKVKFNSKYSEYPAYLDNDSLYIVAASAKKKKNAWNNEPTSDIFIVKNSKLKVLNEEINTAYNEGSLVVTSNDSIMYFTRNDFTDNKLGKDSEKITRLKLYRAYRQNNKWTNIEELPFNSHEYSVGHPALSLDETKLYLVSDKEGGKGGTDLYEVDIYDDGSFGNLINMTEFNTSGNEMFPFVDKNGTFYFSSNGHPNLGGLDVFLSNKNSQDVYDKVYNVGKPINSPFDDFAFVIDAKQGYFSSNRDSESDDIYNFKELKPFEKPCYMHVNGVVRDLKTGELIPNSKVSIIDSNNKIINEVYTDQKASYSLSDLECKDAKFVRVEKDNYQTKEEVIELLEGEIFNEILLEKRKIPIVSGTDLSVLLNPIYFDLNKAKIRNDAKFELDKIIAILEKYPEIRIDIRSHTDSRSSKAYNYNLSHRRAKSTLEYLVNKGIDRSRLTSHGYGESQLINNCSDGVSCTEEQHQDNRRSEFIIINE